MIYSKLRIVRSEKVRQGLFFVDLILNIIFKKRIDLFFKIKIQRLFLAEGQMFKL